MMYTNKRNGQVAEVIELNGKFKTVTIEENGKTKTVSLSTLKRWYTPIEVETIDVDVPDDVDVVENETETEKKSKTTKKSDKKSVENTEEKHSAEIVCNKNEFVKYVTRLASDYCLTPVVYKNGAIAFKRDGKISFICRPTKNRCTLKFTAELVEDYIEYADKVTAYHNTNNRFNASFKFNLAINDKSADLITKLVDAVTA